MHAVDAESGEARWSSKIRAAWPSPPVVTNEYVLFTSTTRHIADSINLHALDISTGQEKWTYSARGGKDYWKTRGAKTPQVTPGNIVILMTDTTVVGVDIDSGKERWRAVEPFRNDLITDGYLGPLLYVMTGDISKPSAGRFYGMNPETGATEWTVPMQGRNNIRTVIDDVVYVETAFLRRSLIAVDGFSGKGLGTAWTPGLGMFNDESYGICSGPVRYGNRLLVSTALQEFAGEQPSRGYLYSVAVPTQNRQQGTH